VRGDAAIRRLEARVQALEAALERRSQDLRRLCRMLPPDQLAAASRMLAAGEDRTEAQRYYRLGWWTPRTTMLSRDVEPVLRSLWRAAPGRGPGGDTDP
jgi:hypothetical protein